LKILNDGIGALGQGVMIRIFEVDNRDNNHNYYGLVYAQL
jgi:hypothetical protein